MEKINSVESSNTEFGLVLLICHIMTKTRTLVSLIRQKPKLLGSPCNCLRIQCSVSDTLFK